MNDLEVNGQRFRVTRAEADDLPALVSLLADDPLGSAREATVLAPYEAAFREIDSDPGQFLAVVWDSADAIVGTMQLSLIPGLARSGATRLHIEAVRVAASARDSGLGGALFAWAHDYGRQNGATLAQLTTDKSRPDAHRFYDRLGYVASHEGYKLSL